MHMILNKDTFTFRCKTFMVQTDTKKTINDHNYVVNFMHEIAIYYFMYIF